MKPRTLPSPAPSVPVDTSLIVLAAGKGSRMRSQLPKVLHQVGGFSLLWHAVKSGLSLSPSRIVIVTGHGSDVVAREAMRITQQAITVHQDAQKGTAHAVRAAEERLRDFDGNVLILYGDTPFISRQTLQRMAEVRADGADVVVLGFESDTPGRYGRLIVEGGALMRIVEYEDAGPAERAVTLCNSGVVLADARRLFALVERVGNDNAAGEYYLTDIVGLAREEGLHCAAVTCDEAETRGVNTRADLAAAEATFQQKRRSEIMEAGVTLMAPETVHFSADTEIGADSVVEPHVVFGPGVRLSDSVKLRAFSHLEGVEASSGAEIGPHARLRPGTRVGASVRIGNFVEVKASSIRAGAKINHLSYIGDADIGDRANIGAGTVTCNFDGVSKHSTKIGAEAFIGSDTMLIAPVRVGEGAITASGSVITNDVPDGNLAIARQRQVNKPGYAAKIMTRLRNLGRRRSE